MIATILRYLYLFAKLPYRARNPCANLASSARHFFAWPCSTSAHVTYAILGLRVHRQPVAHFLPPDPAASFHPSWHLSRSTNQNRISDASSWQRIGRKSKLGFLLFTGTRKLSRCPHFLCFLWIFLLSLHHTAPLTASLIGS